MQVIERGRIQVFTFRQGLLSAIAHDLCLELERFEIRLESQRLRGTFWPGSLRVVGVMHDGRCDEHELREDQKREIVDNIRSKVLKVDEYPEAALEATFSVQDGDVTATGELMLVGRQHDIALKARIAGGSVSGDVELVPSRWSIAPFRALLGAIRLQDRVLVRFELTPPAEALGSL